MLTCEEFINFLSQYRSYDIKSPIWILYDQHEWGGRINTVEQFPCLVYDVTFVASVVYFDLCWQKKIQYVCLFTWKFSSNVLYPWYWLDNQGFTSLIIYEMIPLTMGRSKWPQSALTNHRTFESFYEFSGT